jgi:hypothetical protein
MEPSILCALSLRGDSTQMFTTVPRWVSVGQFTTVRIVLPRANDVFRVPIFLANEPYVCHVTGVWMGGLERSTRRMVWVTWVGEVGDNMVERDDDAMRTQMLVH